MSHELTDEELLQWTEDYPEHQMKNKDESYESPADDEEGLDHPTLPNIDEIPIFFSISHQKQFETQLRQMISSSITVLPVDPLRSLAVHLYQRRLIELEQSLWKTYLRYGTEKQASDGVHGLPFWPISLLTLMKHQQRSIHFSQSDTHIYETFVRQQLADINQRHTSIQKQIQTQQQQIDHYTEYFDQAIHSLVDQEVSTIGKKYEYRLAMIQLKYEGHLLRQEWYTFQLNRRQINFLKRLFHSQYQYEKAQKEVHSFDHDHKENSCTTSSMIICSKTHLIPIQSIQNQDLREQLLKEQQKILRDYRRHLREIHRKIWENKCEEYKTIYDSYLLQISTDSPTSPSSFQWTTTIDDWIQRRTSYITKKLDLIYHYKR